MKSLEPIILGSASPRRKEILSYFSLPFIPINSGFNEESIPFEGNPKNYASTLAEKKGEALIKQHPNAIILTADTLVFCEGKVYNKPLHAEEAICFLSTLSGKWHSVYTGVSLRKEKEIFTETAETKILFHKLTPEQMRRYVHTISFADKAGGYAIQGAGGVIVERIEGCYYNVMGLPINTVSHLLSKVGIDLWDYLRE